MKLLRTLDEKVNPKLTALLVLDVIRGGRPPTEDSGPPAGGIIPNLLSLIEACRGASVGIIYVRNAHGDWVDAPSYREKKLATRPEDLGVYAQEGTPGADLAEGLRPLPGEAVIFKHSYSAWAHGPMDIMLRTKGIKTVLLTGGSVMGAVETAAKDAYVRGYYVVVVKDCVYPMTGPGHDFPAGYIEEKLGTVTTTAELAEIWSRINSQ